MSLCSGTSLSCINLCTHIAVFLPWWDNNVLEKTKVMVVAWVHRTSDAQDKHRIQESRSNNLLL